MLTTRGDIVIIIEGDSTLPERAVQCFVIADNAEVALERSTAHME